MYIWVLCPFSLVVDRDLLKCTRTDGVKSTSDHVSRLVFLLSYPQNSSINHLNFYCIKQIDYIFPCVHMYCNRSQKTSQRVKNNSHATRICLVSYFLFFCLYITDYSTHARKIVIYLLYIPNSEVWYIYRMQVH